jgi:chitin synthase
LEESGRLHCRQKINSRAFSVVTDLRLISKASRSKPVVAHIDEYTTQVRLTILGFPAILGLLQSRYPVEQFPLPVLPYVWTHYLTQHLRVFQGAMPSPSLIHHLWKALGINSSVGGACGEFIALKGVCGRKLLNLLGPSPVQLRKVPFFDVVPDNSQNFEYRMSNNPEKPSYVASDFLPTGLTSSL